MRNLILYCLFPIILGLTAIPDIALSQKVDPKDIVVKLNDGWWIANDEPGNWFSMELKTKDLPIDGRMFLFDGNVIRLQTANLFAVFTGPTEELSTEDKLMKHANWEIDYLKQTMSKVSAEKYFATKPEFKQPKLVPPYLHWSYLPSQPNAKSIRHHYLSFLSGEFVIVLYGAVTDAKSVDKVVRKLEEMVQSFTKYDSVKELFTAMDERSKKEKQAPQR